MAPAPDFCSASPGQADGIQDKFKKGVAGDEPGGSICRGVKKSRTGKPPFMAFTRRKHIVIRGPTP
jgi:hypothetical protein